MADVPKHESAKIILKLYQLRHEEKMSEARHWFYTFKPKSFGEVQAVVSSADITKLRMVLAYWEMAATLVNHGAIDEKMFVDANTEFWLVFAKAQPFLGEARKIMGKGYLAQLEALVLRQPGAQAKLDIARTRS